MIPFKKIATFFILLTLILFITIFCNQEWYRLFPKKELNSQYLQLLLTEGTKAIDCLDVPVSSVIVFKDKILSSGYNTVIKDNNAGGHAEINAISQAIKNIGHNKFATLNRDSLLLITTYEPCLMCKGAIINNRIKNVLFIGEKDLLHHISNMVENFKYELHKRKSEEDTLQFHLFNLHQNYSKKEEYVYSLN